jgi:hypothetical protein
MRGAGFLTIWSDIAPERETDYIHWLTREHTTERVSAGGFLAVRVFRALIPDHRRYLINYELETPEAVAGPDYVNRLNNPTPWTQRTLPVLENFIRGGGRVLHAAGIGQGGFLTALTIAGQLPANSKDIVDSLVQGDRIAAVRLFETDPDKTAVKTKEKGLRKVDPGADDRSFAGVLLIEGIDENAVKAALGRLSELAPDIVSQSTVGALIYSSVFTLEKRII